MSKGMDQLRLELSNLQKISHCSGEKPQGFYPPSVIQSLLTIDAIRDCISTIPTLNGNPRDVNRYAQIIHNTCLRIFAILLYNKDEAHISQYLFRREQDSRIPYTEEALYFLVKTNYDVARRFLDNQMRFHPIVFDKEDIHLEIKDDEILPFDEEEWIGEGAFGMVYKVKLYPDCQKLVAPIDDKDVFIARKKLKFGDDGSKERKILELLSTLEHSSIVRFLGSYTRFRTTSLLFPFISMNMKNFLEAPPFSYADVIYEGMYNLSDALAKIHVFFLKDKSFEISKIGYHHDLRPVNILVDDTNFVIADFGLSELKPNDKDSKTRLQGGHDDYLGPESFNACDWTNGMVGRALDIWALGCILAEVAVLLGGQSVKAFYESRKEEVNYGNVSSIDHAFHLNGGLRPSVDATLSALEEDRTNPQIKEFVTLIRQTLNPNALTRVKIQDITPELALLAAQSKLVVINSYFLELSYDMDKRNAEVYKLILLERKLFDAWHLAFFELHKGEQLNEVRHLIAALNNLRDILKRSTEFQDRDENYWNEHPTESKGQLQHISSAVDFLCRLLPAMSRERLDELWTRAVCKIQDDRILQAIASTPRSERYRKVGVDAAKAFMSRAISNAIRFGQRTRLVDSGCVELDQSPPSRIQGLSGMALVKDRSRTIGRYLGDKGWQRVMVEWKEYDHRWKQEPGEEIFKTMDALVNLLDSEVTPRMGVTNTRLLDCVAYFHESKQFRFGFVYLLPMNPGIDNEQLKLYSLNNVIKMTSPNEAIRPDLGDIFLLAKDLAACLYALHQVGWLHKKISSHNILVFSPSTNAVYQHVSSAVLAGFDDSRPEASSVTLGPHEELEHYRHPSYISTVGFRKSFDYFSFGIVLLELGLWAPISRIRKDHSKDYLDAEGFRKKLVNTYVPMLGEKMGALYRDAVYFCLGGDGPGRENTEGFLDDDLFKVHVVKKLDLCSA